MSFKPGAGSSPGLPEFAFGRSHQTSMNNTGSFQNSHGEIITDFPPESGPSDEAKRYTFNPNDYQEFRRMVMQKQNEQNMFGGSKKSSQVHSE